MLLRQMLVNLALRAARSPAVQAKAGQIAGKAAQKARPA